MTDPARDPAPGSLFRPGVLAGQRILVTGGGTGLGRAMTERFVALGADCYICGRRESVVRETAAALSPVIPVAVIGTDEVRRGWRIRPRKVRVRFGSPLRFPRVDSPSRELAGAVTDRIWPCIALQWQWLGGEVEGAPALPEAEPVPFLRRASGG